MVKSVLGVNYQGLRDWVVQRLSAILMTLYSLGLITYIAFNPGLSYAEWHHLFSLTWVKILTILFLLGLLLHAWIGMRTIFTDYIKSFVLSSILHSLLLFLLAVCFIWGLLILWGI